MGPGGIVNVLPAVVQSVVTQYNVTSVTLADADEIARVSSDPTIDKTRIPLGAPAVGEGASLDGCHGRPR